MLFTISVWLFTVTISHCRPVYVTDIEVNLKRDWAELEYTYIYEDDVVKLEEPDLSNYQDEDLFEGDLAISQDLINAFYGTNAVSYILQQFNSGILTP